MNKKRIVIIDGNVIPLDNIQSIKFESGYIIDINLIGYSIRIQRDIFNFWIDPPAGWLNLSMSEYEKLKEQGGEKWEMQRKYDDQWRLDKEKKTTEIKNEIKTIYDSLLILWNGPDAEYINLSDKGCAL